MLYITLVIMLVYLRSHSKQFQILKIFQGKDPKTPLSCLNYCCITRSLLLVCMLALGKIGGDGIVIFTCDDHYRLTNTMWARYLCTFFGSLMGKTREK